LRYEQMTFTRDDFGKADPDRTGAALKTTENKVDVWIPGIGLEYKFSESINGFFGIHRGFAPPGATEGTSPENSVNYEIGSHVVSKTIQAQGVLFYNDYKNLLGSDLAAGGGSGSGDQFNAGNAITYGAEVEFSYSIRPAKLSNLSFPVSLAYTYTNGEFQSSFAAINEDWGTVQEGDKIPYLSNHQLVLNAGLQHTLFNFNLSTKFNSEMRTSPGQGEIPVDKSIEDNFIVDVSASYSFTRYLSVFGSANNLFDSNYVVARRPAGLRPGMPRAFQIGLKVNL
jgi:Fe(3+) dicitrate transport protein